MAVRPIVILGDPVLHVPTAPVPVGPDGSLPADLTDLITDMYDTMAAANGVHQAELAEGGRPGVAKGHQAFRLKPQWRLEM